jgi:hypothetical protein
MYRRHLEKLERDHGEMRTVMGNHRRLPPAVDQIVVDVAVELGRQVAGDDLFLLALARLGPGSAGVATVDGEDSVYVDDPFGNRMELLERSDTLRGPP